MSNFAKIRERNEKGQFVVPTIPSGFDVKEYRKKRYIKNKKCILKKTKEWAKNNPEKVKLYKDRWRSKNKGRTNYLTRKYIYRRKNAEGKLSFEEEKYIYSRFLICPYCNTNESDTLDHVIPLSKGGNNDTSNVIAVCRSCNSKKNNKSLVEFNPILFVMWNRLRV